nr:MAG TPA: hypothetical protein [Caudoviricetes sp.]
MVHLMILNDKLHKYHLLFLVAHTNILLYIVHKIQVYILRRILLQLSLQQILYFLYKL